MKPISTQVDEIMTGLNPSADDRMAADLGVKITEPPKIARITHEECCRSVGYVRGIAAVREVLKKHNVNVPIEVVADVLELTVNADTLAQNPI